MPEAGLWRRIGRDLVHPSRGQFLVAGVLFLIGLLVVTQLAGGREQDTYSSMRRTDLVQLLDQLNAEQERLSQESTRLEKTKQELASGADARRIAAEQNSKRLDQLHILAGTVGAKGPGIRLTIVDPQHKVGPEILLDAVEEMRDAGAEAIEINDQVRVVAQSWFSRDGQQLVADGKPLQTPLVLDVIGEPHALEEGARFRGGLVSQVQAEAVGGEVAISRLEEVRITALHESRPVRWAKPA
ncbi:MULTISPECIES: DUF881 domain-containing protein [unclassified Luteococcus]|uniref:DUF881 domain-containing protein n=1 Tax=unclassified Luteococcus TaxID=2639923 RepID=UPI00313C2BE9